MAASVQAITIRPSSGLTIQIKMMDDHYAVLSNDIVIGTITRTLNTFWSLNALDGRNGTECVSLQTAMDRAMKWGQP